jgi:structure-specific endonuclease subunit SLX1
MLDLAHLSVAHALLRLPPFQAYPLHIRFFNVETQAMFQKLPIITSVTTILDLGGVSGGTGNRRSSTKGVTSQEGPIDVQDVEFRRGSRVWDKWKALERQGSANCGVCAESIDIHVRLMGERANIRII